jgi:EmrB/QacA subfamily drug resistance transporter
VRRTNADATLLDFAGLETGLIQRPRRPSIGLSDERKIRMASAITQQSTETAAKFWILLTASLVSSLIMLDSNIVAVSLPAIGRSLDASFTDVQWVISAYVLTYAALLMASGNYADLRGRRKSMLIGLVVFAVSSAACGVATSSPLLNLARAVQGVGGAFLLTASLAILSNAFMGVERTHAFAFWGASLGIALALGPIIGGVITNFFGWRWVFLVNVPASAILILGTLRFISESRDPNAKRLDYLGTVTFSAGLAILIWALIDGNDAGWSSPSILVRLATALILLAAFVVVETRQDRPMVDFGLFRRKTFVGAVLAMIGYGASAQVMIFFLPLYLQNAYGFGPLAAGVAMIPFALPMVLAPRETRRLATRYSGRALLTAGLAITVLGNLAFWVVAKSHLPYGSFLVAMLIAGCGAGLLNGQTVKVLQGAVPEDRAGMASGIASTTRFIGILVSVAALGAVLADVARDRFVTVATHLGLAADVARKAAVRVTSGDLAGLRDAVPPGLRDALSSAALAEYGTGFASAAMVAAAVAFVACVLAYGLISADETAPVGSPAPAKMPCKVIDCRDPL